MISLSGIENNYPENIRGFKRFILREYLQYKLLQILFDSEYASQFIFLGGTCLRIVYGNARFSEDLDFDHLKITESVFEDVSALIKNKLESEGYEIELRTVYKGAYHCYIRFPKLLYRHGLSGHLGEKILVQLDIEPQHFEFTPLKYILNRFDVFTQINVTPLDILLSQKFYALLNRNRNKGRDFFDVIFLLTLIDKPNYAYLEQKAGITNPTELKARIIEKCEAISLEEMAKDVQPFLFNPEDIKKIILFKEYIKQVKL